MTTRTVRDEADALGAAGATPVPSPQRLDGLVRALASGLVERQAQARCALLAVLCGEHLLLIGPPGTAKSALARRLNALIGGRYFERLLTRFTVPEELFGPLSLEALDHGRYERAIDGYLPTATIAFLDEVFKANSAILNALLTILNEREFDQGSVRLSVPLVALVGASNEIPVDESLRAFFDRFLFRCHVRPVSAAAFGALLAEPGPSETAPEALTMPEVRALQALAQRVVIPGDVLEAIAQLKDALGERGIEASDRRWVRIAHALRVSAASRGRPEVDWIDLWLLSLLVPERAEDAEGVERWLAERIARYEPLEPERLARVVEAFEGQLEVEAEATEFVMDESGKLALARRMTGADEEQLQDAAPRMSAFSRRRRYGRSHIGARLAQIDRVLGEADVLSERVGEQRAALLDEARSHLWVDPSFVARLQAALAESARRIDGLRVRLAEVRQAFAMLPLADDDDGTVPASVSHEPLDEAACENSAARR
ncbi:MAG: AAA family ATPase [Burkholderiales bacterium]|nr:MAG: AAA family ATPase [Burkholderiales bacterium]